jgi:tetratricopeptide (TPR) repeat protein
MRAEFLRSTKLGYQGTRTSQHPHLLQVYLDLSVDSGPIHARAAYAAATRMVDGSPADRYQINTPSFLRAALANEIGDRRHDVRDPRELPAALRSDRFELLCRSVDGWAGLSTQRQVTVATVLNKLGLWDALGAVVKPAAGADECTTRDQAALLTFWANAEFKRGGAEGDVFAELSANRRLPVPVRIDAAINQIVHLVRIRAGAAEMQESSKTARALMDTLDDADRSPLRHSIYLRGLSFVPYLGGDAATAHAMLDEAEQSAETALDTPAVPRLLAEENLHPLLETRAKEAEWSGDLDLAEHRYRRLAGHDPYDAKTWVRLGDFLHRHGRAADARPAYLEAATLGAPFTAYALTQAARCSQSLRETPRAVAYLHAAARAEPGSVTPLVLLAEHARRPEYRQLLSWVPAQLDELHVTTERTDRA